MNNLEQIHHPSYLTLPSHYTTAFFTTAREALLAIEDLESLGFASEDLSILEGPRGIDAIDLEGKKHSFWSEYRRKISQLADGAEWHFLTDAEKELSNSHLLLLVPTQGNEVKEVAIRSLKKNGGYGLRYITNFTIEEFN